MLVGCDSNLIIGLRSRRGGGEVNKCGDAVKVEPIRLSCFALGIREWGRHIQGR